MKKKVTICIVLLITCTSIVSRIQAQEQIIASWELGSKPGLTQIIDSKSNFSLTKNVSFADGCYSGVGDIYWSSLDLHNNSWTVEGTFKTINEASAVMVIIGNRSALSEYTGWDFIMLKDGTLRFMAIDSKGKGRTLTSSTQRFDDSEQHQFTLLWNPDKSQISMTIDKHYNYSASCVTDLSGNSSRIFYIGAQATNSGGKVAPFKGELKNFIFKGTLIKEVSANRSLESIDKEMIAKTQTDATTLWVDSKELTIEGMGWKNDITDYTRLPNKYQSQVTTNVWEMSRQSSGITVNFTVKGTSMVSARWDLRFNGFMPHMTPQGAKGLDLYAKINNVWEWIGVGKPSKDGLQQEMVLRTGFDPNKSYLCKLYLPLYSGVSSVQIGVASGAEVVAALPSHNKPIVFYGTSITQGCSSSRAGMSYTAQLGRRFDTPIVNLGFSGNGLMEAHFVPILADIDASVYVIDCLGNMGSMTPEEVSTRTLTLVRKLRSARQTTPIVLMEDRLRGMINLKDEVSVSDVRAKLRSTLKACYTTLSQEMKGLYYVEEKLLSTNGSEALVDGGHPSDLGMHDYFIGIEPLFSTILTTIKKSNEI